MGYGDMRVRHFSWIMWGLTLELLIRTESGVTLKATCTLSPFVHFRYLEVVVLISTGFQSRDVYIPACGLSTSNRKENQEDSWSSTVHFEEDCPIF